MPRLQQPHGETFPAGHRTPTPSNRHEEKAAATLQRDIRWVKQPTAAPPLPVTLVTGSLRSMLISTMNDLPGYEVTDVLGEVFGLTVRSRNIGSQIGAGFKALAGGELKGMTKNLVTSRQDVIDRMVAEAQMKGADAILAMRFDTSEMGGNWTEICAYGTAVKIRKVV